MIKEGWVKNKINNKDYKGFIGDPTQYNNIGKIIFNLLKKLGLKPTDKFLDIGCGSLRVGKYLIDYLNKSNYRGIEPNEWLICEAIENENINFRGKEVLFRTSEDFELTFFDEKFDFILANSIFIHASKNQIERCFEEVNKVLKNDGGMFLFNFIEGDKDSQEKNWSYPCKVEYTMEYINSIINKYNNFHVMQVDCKYPGKQKFLLITNKKG
jgi:cyclopropane fatty-acyl-phospholipid synthase-like methyltransferase